MCQTSSKSGGPMEEGVAGLGTWSMLRYTSSFPAGEDREPVFTMATHRVSRRHSLSKKAGPRKMSLWMNSLHGAVGSAKSSNGRMCKSTAMSAPTGVSFEPNRNSRMGQPSKEGRTSSRSCHRCLLDRYTSLLPLLLLPLLLLPLTPPPPDEETAAAAEGRGFETGRNVSEEMIRGRNN